ncbi:MAG: hypothetical protein K0B01_08035 [Syntrophobacterales bacterium]|nr:hypothetical protein [Syntrophobacterales bacterium]
MKTIESLYDLLSHIPLVYPIYFFYGAAFLFLGISILGKDLKASDLRLSDSLWMLGTFGFIHGFHEWLQLLPLIQGEHMTLQEIYLIKLILFSTLVLSFSFLLQFGLSLISALDKKQLRWIKGLPSALSLLWAVILWRNGRPNDLFSLWQVEIGVRYTIGLMGGLVTGYGLIRYSHEIKSMSEPVAT